MSYLDWKVGDRVVCIVNSCVRINDLGLPGFRKGQTFTITELIWVEPYGLFLAFKERDPRNTAHVKGFRKVQTRKTSIACFEAILNGQRVPEDA